MSDTTEAIKKYWPWVAGGVVGLILITKMRGGSSGSADPLAAAYAAQQQYAMQNAALGQQAKAQEQAYQLGLATINGQLSSAMAQMDAQKAVALADIGRQQMTDQAMIAGQTMVGSLQAQANYTLAQGQAGLAAAQGASLMMAQLQAPAIAGINASANENIAAMNAAGAISVAGFGSLANMIQSSSGAAVGMSTALAGTNLAQSASIASMSGSLGNQIVGITGMQPNENSGSGIGGLLQLGGTIVGGMFGGPAGAAAGGAAGGAVGGAVK